MNIHHHWHWLLAKCHFMQLTLVNYFQSFIPIILYIFFPREVLHCFSYRGLALMQKHVRTMYNRYNVWLHSHPTRMEHIRVRGTHFPTYHSAALFTIYQLTQRHDKDPLHFLLTDIQDIGLALCILVWHKCDANSWGVWAWVSGYY